MYSNSGIIGYYFAWPPQRWPCPPPQKTTIRYCLKLSKCFLCSCQPSEGVGRQLPGVRGWPNLSPPELSGENFSEGVGLDIESDRIFSISFSRRSNYKRNRLGLGLFVAIPMPINKGHAPCPSTWSDPSAPSTRGGLSWRPHSGPFEDPSWRMGGGSPAAGPQPATRPPRRNPLIFLGMGLGLLVKKMHSLGLGLGLGLGNVKSCASCLLTTLTPSPKK